MVSTATKATNVQCSRGALLGWAAGTKLRAHGTTVHMPACARYHADAVLMIPIQAFISGRGRARSTQTCAIHAGPPGQSPDSRLVIGAARVCCSWVSTVRVSKAWMANRSTSGAPNHAVSQVRQCAAAPPCRSTLTACCACGIPAQPQKEPQPVIACKSECPRVEHRWHVEEHIDR